MQSNATGLKIQLKPIFKRDHRFPMKENKNDTNFTAKTNAALLIAKNFQAIF